MQSAEAAPQCEMPRYRSHKTVWVRDVAVALSLRQPEERLS